MSKYCPELTEEICKHINSGLNRGDACTMSGISFETFRVWMKKPAFSAQIKKAELGFKEYHISLIKKAAEKNWFAAAWMLERKFGEEFAQKQKLLGGDGNPVNLHAAAVLVIQGLKTEPRKKAIDTKAVESPGESRPSIESP